MPTRSGALVWAACACANEMPLRIRIENSADVTIRIVGQILLERLAQHGKWRPCGKLPSQCKLSLWPINLLVNRPVSISNVGPSDVRLAARSLEFGQGASVIFCVTSANVIVSFRPMTHFPQPHPTRRASRVQLGDSVLAAIRLEDGRRTKAKLQTISVTGGLLRLAQSLGQGDFIEVAFQTQSGPVHGMAEALSPMRSISDGVLQPFRFVALEDDDHRRLRTSLDHVAARSSLGMKSAAFSTF